MFTVCPNCQHTFPVPAAGQYTCPKCGAVLKVPQPGSGKPAQIVAISNPQTMQTYIRSMVGSKQKQESSKSQEPKSAIEEISLIRKRKDIAFPWEAKRKGTKTFIYYYAYTWISIVLNSKQVFKEALDKKISQKKAFSFAMLSLSVGLMFNLITSAGIAAYVFGKESFTSYARELGNSLYGLYMFLMDPASSLGLWALLVPFFVPVVLALWLILIWMGMRIGKNAVVSINKIAPLVFYATAPMLWLVIPVIGLFVAPPWWLYTTRNALLFYEGNGAKIETVLSIAYAILCVVSTIIIFFLLLV